MQLSTYIEGDIVRKLLTNAIKNWRFLPTSTAVVINLHNKIYVPKTTRNELGLVKITFGKSICLWKLCFIYFEGRICTALRRHQPSLGLLQLQLTRALGRLKPSDSAPLLQYGRLSGQNVRCRHLNVFFCNTQFYFFHFYCYFMSLVRDVLCRWRPKLSCSVYSCDPGSIPC